MSTVAATKLVNFDSIKYTWAAMVTGDTITAVQVPANCGDRSVQFTGTFAGGTSMSLTGSNVTNGTGTYVILTDPQGNAITKTATTTALEQITEITQWLAPTISSGSADSVTCTVFISRTKKGGI